MHPILFTFPAWIPLIGGHSIHVYGLMIALGFLAGLWWIKRESRRLGVNVTKVVDVFFYVLLAGLLGARILYVINSVDNFWADPLVIFRVWEGGLVFQGGIIGAFLVMLWSSRRYKLSFLQLTDIFSPALALGHAFGRIGCFFAGCCYGRPSPHDFPFSVIFPQIADGIAPPGIPLYPTQLFESIGELIIFAILVTYRKKKSFDGAVFFLYLILYSILRSFIELFRGDLIRGFIVEPYLSIAQFISLMMVIAAIFAWVYMKKRSGSRGQETVKKK